MPYVDFGEKRGRLKFTPREIKWIAGVLFTISSTAVGYVIRSEVALADCKNRLSIVEKRPNAVAKPSPSYYCGPPCGTELEKKP